MLTVRAGTHALKRIRSEGFQPELFRAMIGASGGPKWFVLYGLDRYLADSFLPRIQTPIATFGSSAGAWRMACHATRDPVAAIDRLADHYSHETYTEKADREEITDKARIMLDYVLGSSGAAEIADNPRFRTHLIAARCRGPLASENRFLQGLGLAGTALTNAISRKALALWMERTIFHTQHPCMFPDDGLPNQTVDLNKDNMQQALMASGAIPLVLYGQRRIPGARTGCYRDGGLTDYHFDAPFSRLSGLVLYPHFYDHLIPGWFDKGLPYRRIHRRWFDNVVLLSPSDAFVRQLPFRKIPDRKDFTRMGVKERVNYWQKVLGESERLAEALDAMVERGQGIDNIQPLE
jgi:hypothetical protein